MAATRVRVRTRRTSLAVERLASALHAIIGARRRRPVPVPPAAARLDSARADTSLSPYELAVGLRYTRARRGSGRNTFISFIALTSMAGIALGVAALIVVLSVMNGFQEELRNRILAVASHIEIRGMPTLADDAAVAADGHDQSAREGRGAVRAGAGDALGRRSEPRRASSAASIPRAKRRSPTSARTCAPGRSPT